MKINKMLIVEDDSVSAFVAKRAFKQVGIAEQIVWLENGQLALDYLLNECADSFPELIVVDLNMPVLTGFDFLRLIKDNPYYDESKCKIIVATSTSAIVDREKVKQLGNFPYYNKPITKPKAEEIAHVLYPENAV